VLNPYYILLSCLFACPAVAQDANYWSAEYNPAGFLTPGASVAYTRDSGVLYYNPALLAYNNKNTANISGSLYQYNSLRVRNGAGTGYNLNSTNLSIIPVVAAGIIAVKKFSIGYAVIHNPVIGFQSTQQRDDKFNVLNDVYSPGNEDYIAQYSMQNTVNETSGLLSTGFKISPHFALGFSVEALFHQQHFVENMSARALMNVVSTSGLSPVSNAEDSYEVTHYSAGIKGKMGLSYDIRKHHIGVTVTSPFARIKGNAEMLSDNVVTDLLLTPQDTINLLATTRQTKLKEKWKTPLSIALGYAYDVRWGQVYVSTEYFTRIKEYNVISPRNEYFIRTTDPDKDNFSTSITRFKDARKNILNVGIGIKYYLTPEVTGYVSARTDFCYASKNLFADDEGFAANTSYANMYHWQIGANLKKRKFNLRTGLLFGYGRTNNYPQAINMSNPNESNFLMGDTKNTRATNLVMGLMLGYIHNL
jgi:hypothetical protein